MKTQAELAELKIEQAARSASQAYVRELEERVRLATSASETGGALARGDALPAVLKQCVELLVKDLDAALARIWILNRPENVLELQASAGLYTHVDGPHGRIPVGQFKIGLIAEELKPHLTNDVINDPHLHDHEWARREGLVAFAGHPLLAEGALIGVMVLFFRRTLSAATFDALEQFADRLGLGIDRRMAGDRLRRSEEQFTAFMENLPAAAFVKNAAGQTLFANLFLASLMGFRDWKGKTTTELVAGALGQKMTDDDKRAIESGPLKIQETVTDGAGATRTFETIKFPIHVSGSPTLLGGIAVDITEIKQAEAERSRLQDQLNQAQRMESVGRLAGGVAHDFNNMLGVIIGHTEMALEHAKRGSALRGDLEEIRRAAERSTSLTRQLLAFARKQTAAPIVIDLNKTIEAALTMLRRLIGENLDLVWQPGLDLWPVKLDPGQVDQVLTNLCVNARDAIAGVGKVTIETGNVIVNKANASPPEGCVEGPYVRLSISDSGAGMDEETKAHLFEPFFTTKETGAGTGLGLATVYGIVKQNGGFIDVVSQVGQGTRFSFFFPSHHRRPDEPAWVGASRLVAGHGQETLMLVEDEPAILALNKRILESLGYRVLAAGTPGEAVRLAEAHGDTIHLLMTDVVMPGMNGRDLANCLLTINPSMKLLFTSGYTADIIAQSGVLTEGLQFLQKPYSKQTLAAKVREVLDQE